MQNIKIFWKIFIQNKAFKVFRLNKNVKKTLLLLDYLNNKKGVKKVIYPKFHDGIFRERVIKYLNKGYGSLVGFEVDGGLDVGKEFINNLKLIYHVANIGDARTLAIHPASTTHQQLTPEEQMSAGVTPTMVRVSVGIEHIDDILEDFEQGLNLI